MNDLTLFTLRSSFEQQ